MAWLQEFLIENYEWIFSGIGNNVVHKLAAALVSTASAVAAVIAFFKRLYLKETLLVFGTVVIMLVIFISQEPKGSEKITEAFHTVFGSEWSAGAGPINSHDKEQLCYEYQGRWALDKDEYFLEFPGQNEYIYYVAKLVDLYTWCQLGTKGQDSERNEKIGDILEGMEIMTNFVYVSSKSGIKSIDQISSEADYVGKISGIFSDRIIFNRELKKPGIREGTRIGRYRYEISDERMSSKRANEIMNIVVDNLKSFSPECGVEMSRLTDGKLVKNQSVMEFNCEHTSKIAPEGKPYEKKLVYKGH